jgi:hypothetical protein
LPDVEIKGTTFTGSKYGVVVNGQHSHSGGDPAAAAAPKNAGNSYDGIDNESSGIDLPVPDSAP